jgi:flagellar biosynthetic protein FlhB
MSTEQTSEDRTEAPTARRLQKAREDGETARSSEVPAAAVMILAAIYLQIYGGHAATALRTLFASGFIFDKNIVHAGETLPAILADHVLQGFLAVLPLLAVTLFAALAASGITGGFLFAIKLAAPQFGKLNPWSGLQRAFGARALVELAKTILKFVIVTMAVCWVVEDSLTGLVRLGAMNVEPALTMAAELIVRAILIVTLSFALIGLIDFLYQRHAFSKRMRMSKQEIRDEMKDIEGRPEVRFRIRQRQREMATTRMMDRVKDADVVITNPEHFAVALSYDPSKNGAPILLAKGVDSMALAIINSAKNTGVHTFQAPPLARALFFTTKLNQPIHEELYFAVAQVIAYVFSLNSFQPGMSGIRRPETNVPSSVRFDSDGKLESVEASR